MTAPARHASEAGGTLVIQTAFLGDVILTTPLLAVLAERHGPVDVVTTPAAAPLLEGHPAVGAVRVFDKRGADRGWSGVRRLARLLRGRRYARAYLPHRSLRSAWLALDARIPERVGFAGRAAAWGYTERVARPRTGHEVDRLLALAGRTGAGAPGVRIAVTRADRAAATDWLAQRGIGDGFVAMAPGSVWATKRWPYYAELAASLDVPVVVLGGTEDRSLAESIVGAAPGRAFDAAGGVSLREAAALLERAAVLVTNDSAPLHLAQAVETPVVAIFGPTTAAFGFGPRGPRDRTLGHAGLACRPCSHHGPMRCPLGHHRCMRDLSVQDVLAAVHAVRSA